MWPSGNTVTSWSNVVPADVDRRALGRHEARARRPRRAAALAARLRARASRSARRTRPPCWRTTPPNSAEQELAPTEDVARVVVDLSCSSSWSAAARSAAARAPARRARRGRGTSPSRPGRTRCRRARRRARGRAGRRCCRSSSRRPRRSRRRRRRRTRRPRPGTAHARFDCAGSPSRRDLRRRARRRRPASSRPSWGVPIQRVRAIERQQGEQPGGEALGDRAGAAEVARPPSSSCAPAGRRCSAATLVDVLRR